jgi:hypothetical protein
MLCREIIAVCSEIHTKHIYSLGGQNVELLGVNSGGTYSDHGTLIVKTPMSRKMKWHLCAKRQFTH